jgi:Tfp pilus assembly protein PilV
VKPSEEAAHPNIRSGRFFSDNPAKGQSGLTLLEVLAAFSILAIAGLGLFAIGSMATKSNIRNANQIAAAALASSKLEDLRSLDFDSLSSGSDGPLGAGGTSGGIFSRSWTVATTSITGVTTSAKTLAVTVTWTGGGSITMNTMVVKPAQVMPSISVGISSGFPTVAVKAMEQTQ